MLAINILLTLGLLGAIEGCVRLTYPQIQPLGTEAVLIEEQRFGPVAGPRPSAAGLSNGARVSVDQEGFWQYAAQPPADAPVWLFLGDSVTMGLGVPPDSTFAGRLAALRPAAVRNAALIGHGAHDYPVVLRHLLQEMHPDRITLVWCLNDAQHVAVGDPDAALRRRLGPVVGFFHRHVRTYVWAKATFTDRPMRYLEHDLSYYEGDAFGPAFEALAEIATVARAANVPMDLVVIPYEAQLRSGAGVGVFLPQQRLAAAADMLGLRLVDATEALHGSEPQRWFLYGDGIHLSTEGHARVARFLDERL